MSFLQNFECFCWHYMCLFLMLTFEYSAIQLASGKCWGGLTWRLLCSSMQGDGYCRVQTCEGIPQQHPSLQTAANTPIYHLSIKLHAEGRQVVRLLWLSTQKETQNYISSGGLCRTTLKLQHCVHSKFLHKGSSFHTSSEGEQNTSN